MNAQPIPNLTLRQIMLSFAYLAYTGEGKTYPNPEASILASIQAALPKIKISSQNDATLSDWEVAWGPVTYTVPGALYQENMLYVVNKAGTSDYVIATRGTNFGSQVDWFLEDFEVMNTMKWPIPGAQSNCQAGSAISESTSIGMAIQTDSSLMVDSHGVGLLEFLKTTTEKLGSINVCVTGHSLGGVLSNTLALYLTENPNLWDTSGHSIVSCISFAAPTGGNELFAKNAIKVFKESVSEKGSFPGWDSSLGTNLDNVMCNMDIVPMFCTATNIYDDVKAKAGSIFSVYASGLNQTDNINFENLKFLGKEEWKFFQSMVLKKVAGLMDHNYTQLQADKAFQGEFMGDTLTFEADSFLAPYLEAFAAQSGWQHSNSYPIYLQMPMLSDPTIIVRAEGPTPAIPVITSISPGKVDKLEHLTGRVKVEIIGTGFSPDSYGNFIVFSKSPKPIRYRMVSATETKIEAVFYIAKATDTEYEISVAKTSPYFTSNSMTFTLKF